MSDNNNSKALSPDELESRTIITIKEMSTILGIGRNTAYEAVKKGEIPSVKVGRRILVPSKALDKWLESSGK